MLQVVQVAILYPAPDLIGQNTNQFVLLELGGLHVGLHHRFEDNHAIVPPAHLLAVAESGGSSNPVTLEHRLVLLREHALAYVERNRATVAVVRAVTDKGEALFNEVAVQTTRELLQVDILVLDSLGGNEASSAFSSFTSYLGLDLVPVLGVRSIKCLYQLVHQIVCWEHDLELEQRDF